MKPKQNPTNKMKTAVLSVILTTFSFIFDISPTSAAEHGRSITVKKIHALSETRPVAPYTAGTIRVYVNPASWGSSDCRSDAADFVLDSVNDRVNYLTFLTALSSGWKIELRVDDTLRPVDSVCRITAVNVYP